VRGGVLLHPPEAFRFEHEAKCLRRGRDGRVDRPFRCLGEPPLHHQSSHGGASAVEGGGKAFSLAAVSSSSLAWCLA
jgi:hypothetical protein